MPTSRSLIVLATILAALTWSNPTQASRTGDLSVEILVDGQSLQELNARGATYVEALAGREYSIRLTNHSPRRVAVALAVDGLNSINAKTTSARNAAKWVLSPYQSVTIDGWQTSSHNARRFFFTTEDSSYGAWLGKTDNLGVIEAVLFHERQKPQPVTPWLGGHGAAGESAAPRSKSTDGAPQRRAEEDTMNDEMAATGIGREVDNPVRKVRFDCALRPAAHIRIRYEYRPQLVALGVLPQPADRDPLDRRERAHGFTDSDFAPDPYRGR